MTVADQPVCEGHNAPMEFVEAWVYDRPDISLVLGPRGGGKSYLAAFATRIDSVKYDNHQTKILGGSEAQSRQIYQALGDFRQTRPGMRKLDVIKSFGKERCTFTTGSTVEYIPASDKSVRGPHIPTLRLDEVDGMDPDIRDSAFGMCMELRGVPASISMTSTWHRVGGPMSELLKRGESGAFPVYRFCIFEVLQRCPDSRSGANLENCPDCPLVKWCHADIERTGKPKAKRSNGHYTIKSLIQKVKGLSARVFESDFLCLGPRAEGLWFTTFSETDNVTEAAEFDPALPVYISIDSGVRTGAVFLQHRETKDGPRVNIFADYFSDGPVAEVCALSILETAAQRCPQAKRFVSTDSAGGARNPVGPSVIAEYLRCGLTGERGVEWWPRFDGCEIAGLATIEALLRSADGTISLTIHPRCVDTINAFKGFARAKVRGVFQDYPPNEQHPFEDMIDPIRGVLSIVMPEGRRPPLKLAHVPASRIF